MYAPDQCGKLREAQFRNQAVRRGRRNRGRSNRLPGKAESEPAERDQHGA
jgi:hypothetical protein